MLYIFLQYGLTCGKKIKQAMKKLHISYERSERMVVAS
jgi:hypothetical protein